MVSRSCLRLSHRHLVRETTVASGLDSSRALLVRASRVVLSLPLRWLSGRCGVCTESIGEHSEKALLCGLHHREWCDVYDGTTVKGRWPRGLGTLNHVWKYEGGSRQQRVHRVHMCFCVPKHSWRIQSRTASTKRWMRLKRYLSMGDGLMLAHHPPSLRFPRFCLSTRISRSLTTSSLTSWSIEPPQQQFPSRGLQAGPRASAKVGSCIEHTTN